MSIMLDSIGRRKFAPRPAICAGCGNGFIKNSGVHKMCPECQRKRAVAIYTKSNDQLSTRAVIKGIATNNAYVGSIADAGRPLEFAWIVRFAFPFDQAGSKNSAYVRGRPSQPAKKIALQERHRSYRDALILQAKTVLAGRPIKRNKVWIDIFVQFPWHKGDAVNFVDMVCDALKVALGIDDKWFCINRVDWEICKTEPRLFISVAQEEVEDCLICSTCGLLKPDREFSLNRATNSGRHSRCKDCQASTRPLTRAERRAMEG